MTITITNKQLAESGEALGAIKNAMEGLEPAAIQKLARWLRKIQNELETFHKGRQELLRRHWKTDAAGERTKNFEVDNLDAFDRELDTFMRETVELAIPPLDPALLGKKPRLTVGQLMSLDWWLDQPDARDGASEGASKGARSDISEDAA